MIIGFIFYFFFQKEETISYPLNTGRIFLKSHPFSIQLPTDFSTNPFKLPFKVSYVQTAEKRWAKKKLFNMVMGLLSEKGSRINSWEVLKYNTLEGLPFFLHGLWLFFNLVHFFLDRVYPTARSLKVELGQLFCVFTSPPLGKGLESSKLKMWEMWGERDSVCVWERPLGQ